MRKGELVFNYALVLAPVVIGVGIAFATGIAYSMPRTAFLSMAIFFLAGFALFAKAKLSIIKPGQFFTFGSHQMTKQNRIAYYLGYGGMGIGFLLLMGFVISAS